MAIIALIVFGLCLGSFVNALVWRLHEQTKKQSKANLEKLSITRGRSMCPHCHHELSGWDLIPVLSWLYLGGKCRYCKKPISPQYPIVELSTTILYIGSYLYWPVSLSGIQIAIFVLWLILLIGLMALLVYDLKWFLLPNKLIYPSSVVATLIALLSIIDADKPLIALLNVILAVIVGGGIFYLLFQLSEGKWIGGGDVRLGGMLGLVAGTAERSLMFIFLGSIIGSLISLPLIASHKMKRDSAIPYGPLLIIGLIITQLFGASLIHWYRYHLLNY